MWWHYIANYQGAETYSSEAHGPRSLPKVRNIGQFLAKSLCWIFLSSILRISLHKWDASSSEFGSRISQASTFILGWKVSCGRKWLSSDKSDSTFGRAIAVTPRRASTARRKFAVPGVEKSQWGCVAEDCALVLVSLVLTNIHHPVSRGMQMWTQ